MTNIFQALTALKQKINIINGAPLEENNNGLGNVATAEQRFINREIVPKGVLIDDQFPKAQVVDDYYKHVLQALWNIAHYSSYSYYYGFMNYSRIRTNFLYLDVSWVPKIIDERTFKLGKILQEFLLKSLTTESLSVLPEFAGVRNTVEFKLKEMQLILNKRLAIYDVHRPDKIKETVTCIVTRDAQKAKWLPAQKTFLTAIGNIDTSKNLNILREGLHSESTSRLNKKLQEIEQQITQYEQATASFRIFNDKWLEESLTIKLPDHVSSSPYIQLLAKETLQQKQLILELEQIYNTDYPLIKEPIGAGLNHTHRSGVRLLEENSVIQNLLKMQKQLIEDQLEDSKSLDRLVQNLTEKVTTNSAYIMPVSLATYMTHPDSESSKDIAFYRAKRVDLEIYQASLLKYKTILDGEPSSLPQLKEATNNTFFENALKIPIQLLEQRLASVHKSIQHTDLTIHRLEDEHAKETAQGRKTQIANVSQRIKVAFDVIHHQTGIKEKNAIRGLSQFLEEWYEPAVDDINAKALPKINVLKTILENTDEQIKIKLHNLLDIKNRTARRVELLAKAKVELFNYKRILLSDKNIYLSAQKISQVLLRYYIEGDASVYAFIDEVYRIARSSASWGGINLSNLNNLFDHYSSNPGASSSDAKLMTMVEYINKKLVFIDSEIAKTANNTPHPIEYNLWSLQNKYQQNERELNELMAIQQAKSIERDTLLSSHKKQLEQWDQEKIKKEQIKCLSSVEHLIASIDHNNAMISLHSYQMEFVLADIERDQIYLTKELKRIETLEPKDALEALVQIQEKRAFKAIDFRLQLRIADGLSSQQKEMEKLKKMETQLVTKSEKLRLDIEKIEAEYRELQEKKDRIDALMTRLNQSKMSSQILDEKIVTLRAMQKPVVPIITTPEIIKDAPKVTAPAFHPKAFIPTLAGIQKQFFRTAEGHGIFNEYLIERAKDYWFVDLVRGFVALVFGCFYKSDAQMREEYINQIEHAYNTFQSGEKWDADELLKLIEEGQKRFPSREGARDKSLYSKLESFKSDIVRITAENEMSGQTCISYSKQ